MESTDGRTANGWRRHAGGFIAGLSRQDKRRDQFDLHDPGAIRREAGPGGMFEPGMVVKHRVSRITAQKPQLMDEQNRRKRQRQRQIGEHAAQTEHGCGDGH